MQDVVHEGCMVLRTAGHHAHGWIMRLVVHHLCVHMSRKDCVRDHVPLIHAAAWNRGLQAWLLKGLVVPCSTAILTFNPVSIARYCALCQEHDDARVSAPRQRTPGTWDQDCMPTL